jgi:hypothetical protein
MKRISTENTEIQNISLSHWMQYFQHYLTENRTEYKNNKPQEKTEISQEYIHLDILTTKNAVKKLKNCTASGLQRITAELIKYGTEKSFEMLRHI